MLFLDYDITNDPDAVEDPALRIPSKAAPPSTPGQPSPNTIRVIDTDYTSLSRARANDASTPSRPLCEEAWGGVHDSAAPVPIALPAWGPPREREMGVRREAEKLDAAQSLDTARSAASSQPLAHLLSAPFSALHKMSSDVIKSIAPPAPAPRVEQPVAQGTAGVGIKIARSTRGHGFLITGLAPAGAAKISGQVDVQQVLVAVDGVSLVGRTAAEVGGLLQGAPGEPVTISLVLPSGQRKDVSLRRSAREGTLEGVMRKHDERLIRV
ncbi:hypothetical protein T484DRAFT_1776393 [Baffinella frigidus]|nr:hypothetical protein T484DRAFT_1776393 [Cryptophyta sp. CCMP2293]